MRIFFQNIRTFTEPVQADLKPLTLVVGENSSGKSSFLGIVNTVLDNRYYPFGVNFNGPPFKLGNYNTIASRHIDGSVARSFSLGYSDKERTISANFRKRAGHPSPFSVSAETKHVSIKAERVGSRFAVSATARPANREAFGMEGFVSEGTTFWMEIRFDLLFDNLHKLQKETRQDLLTEAEFNMHRTCYALAPIRHAGSRTYDEPLKEFAREGGDIPFRLASLTRKKSTTYKGLFEALCVFGRSSGLFDDLVIRRLGAADGDPFQLQVVKDGRKTNITDVGYGVGQVLPVLVDTFMMPKNAVLLLQQPEVHLHPRAQAALGTLFAFTAKSLVDGHLIIETHSDFLVDRVRTAVAEGIISHQDVSILFFELVNGSSRIHQIELDRDGNVVNPPECYREFFLQEQLRILRRADRS